MFLLSLPRSGSTLAQRVLATYPGVATSSEPWFLLPLLAPLIGSVPNATSWQQSVDRAFLEFVRSLPDEEEAYLEQIRGVTTRLYRSAAGPEADFFVDKSPPYHWIVDLLFRLFPDGRFVFLWRNPLAVVTSIVETFCDGRWRPDRFRGTLFHGLPNLVAAYERHSEQALALRFEDLVGADHHRAWRQLSEYIGIKFDPDSLAAFSDVRLGGSLGDPTGVREFGRLSESPLRKWRDTVNNPLRRFWCQRYLEWIGDDRLSTMGYSLDALEQELSTTGSGWSGMARDAGDATASATREAMAASLADHSLMSSWAALLRFRTDTRAGVTGGS